MLTAKITGLLLVYGFRTTESTPSLEPAGFPQIPPFPRDAMRRHPQQTPNA